MHVYMLETPIKFWVFFFPFSVEIPKSHTQLDITIYQSSTYLSISREGIHKSVFIFDNDYWTGNLACIWPSPTLWATLW